MISRVEIEHEPGVDVHDVVARAFSSLCCDEPLHKALVAAPEYDLSRLPPAVREFYLLIRDRFQVQLDITEQRVTTAAKKEIDATADGGWTKLLYAGALFALSARAIAAVTEPIDDLGLAIGYELFGIKPAAAVLRHLRRHGLVKPTPTLPETAFRLGRLGDSLGDMSLAEALEEASAQALTREQMNAVALLGRQGARAAQAMTDGLRHDVAGLLEMRDSALARLIAATGPSTAAEIRQMVAEAGRGGWQRLRDALRARLGATSDLWTKIVLTELSNLEQLGRAIQIATGSPRGLRTVVMKIPLPDACRWCKELYLMPDGTPRRFTLEELFENGDNLGRVGSRVTGVSASGRRILTQGPRAGQEAEEYLPVVPATHVGCRCRLVVSQEQIT